MNRKHRETNGYDSLTVLHGDMAQNYTKKDGICIKPGVCSEEIGSFQPATKTHVVSALFTIYTTSEGPFDYWLVVNDLPQTWQLYGFDEDDAEEIINSFVKNPILLPWGDN